MKDGAKPALLINTYYHAHWRRSCPLNLQRVLRNMVLYMIWELSVERLQSYGELPRRFTLDQLSVNYKLNEAVIITTCTADKLSQASSRIT